MAGFPQHEKMKTTICTVLILVGFHLGAEAREWTSAENGKKIDAEFVSSDGANVTIKKGAQTFTLPLARFVAADQEFVREQMAKASEPKPLEGAYTDKFTGDWALAEHDGLPYAIFAAKDLDGSKKYPLILSLHGKSDNNTNGDQIGFANQFSNAANHSKNPCIIIAPLCYQPFGATGGGWNDEPGEKTLDLMKEVIKTCPVVDPDRVYVIGYSMGGFGTSHMVETEPKMFAAAIPVAGCTKSSASALKKMPVWIFHAADDATVDVSCSRELYEEIKRNDEAVYKEFETGGHGIIGQVFSDAAVRDWLFSQSRK